MINRQEWLKTNGFILDPFRSGSFHAETDPLLDMPGLPSYIDHKDTKLLVGSLSDPGPCHLFSKSGGGKSSLRMRIHHEYETSDLLSFQQKPLLIDYTEHTHPALESEFVHHIERIIDLAQALLGTDLQNERTALGQSPELAISRLAERCQDLGYSGVYILVDKVVSNETLRNIAPLMQNRVFDSNQRNFFIVKYFLDESLFSSVQSMLTKNSFSPYLLIWGEDELLQILNQRLIACLDQFIRSDEKNPIARLCDEVFLADMVQHGFTKLGALSGNLSLMWMLGDSLLEEYIFASETRGRLRNLINFEIFVRARDRFFSNLLDSDDHLWANQDAGNGMHNETVGDFLSGIDDKEHNTGKILSAVPVGTSRAVNRSEGTEPTQGKIIKTLQEQKKSGGENKKKQIVFLCYAEEDQEKVFPIYLKLLEHGYKPWMDFFDIHPGQDKEQMKTSAVLKADNLIVLLSNNSYHHEGHFRKEIKIALDNRLTKLDEDPYIIPLRLEECPIDDTLRRLQYVDIFDELGWNRLLRSLQESMRIRGSSA